MRSGAKEEVQRYSYIILLDQRFSIGLKRKRVIGSETWNFSITRSIASVGWSVCRSVCPNFLKGRQVSLQYSNQSNCSYINWFSDLSQVYWKTKKKLRKKQIKERPVVYTKGTPCTRFHQESALWGSRIVSTLLSYSCLSNHFFPHPRLSPRIFFPNTASFIVSFPSALLKDTYLWSSYRLYTCLWFLL